MSGIRLDMHFMQQNLLNIYCIERLQGVGWIPILNFVFGVSKSTTLFQHIDAEAYRGLFTVVDHPDKADYLLIPHTYSRIKKHQHYIRECEALAEKHSKNLILFAYQDSAEHVPMKHTIVFRASQYRSHLAVNEVIMPAFVEDLGTIHGVTIRKKQGRQGDVPSVGFVGKAGFESLMHRFRFYVKNFLLKKDPYKDGVYYRRKAIRALSSSVRVCGNFVLRSSYSGNIKSIPLDPAQARAEYVKNIIESDFTLSPKGDGNYSLRFYETLSLGRIPILLDTECVLPLADTVAYDDVIIRVPYTEINRLPDIVSKLYASWSPKEYEHRQKKAREFFVEYLYMPSFIKKTFNKAFLSHYEQ